MKEGVVRRLYREGGKFLPDGIKPYLSMLIGKIAPSRVKYEIEKNFWDGVYNKNDQSFSNEHYKTIMLAMAGEVNDKFLEDAIVADFGCGPRGSLLWASSARLRIGIDVLVDDYNKAFEIWRHSMCYVKSSEKQIPLPSNYVDFIFTINSLDHTANLKKMCQELIRVLKPGGMLLGSLNIGLQGTITEPNNLTSKKLDRCLFNYLEVISKRCVIRDDNGSTATNIRFDEIYEKQGMEPGDGHRIMWFKSIKPR